MKNEPEQERYYSEKQVTLIIKRASELQSTSAEAPMNPVSLRGLTISEIEQVASELGIQSDYVLAAVRELEHKEDRVSAPWLSGASRSQEIGRLIPGELTEAAWEEVVAEIQAIYDKPGTWEKIGSRYEWAWREKKSSLIVRAHPSQGKTRIQIIAHYGDTVEETWIVAGVIALVSWLVILLPVIEKLPDWSQVLSLLFTFGGGFLITRTALASWYRREHEKMKRLLRKIEVLSVPVGGAVPTQHLPAHPHETGEQTSEQRVSS